MCGVSFQGSPALRQLDLFHVKHTLTDYVENQVFFRNVTIETYHAKDTFITIRGKLEKSTCTRSYVLFNGLYYLKDEFYQSKFHLPKPFILFFSSFISKNVDSMKSRKLRLRKWLVHFSPKEKRKGKYDPSYAGSRSRKSKVEAPLITPLLRATFSSFSFSILSLNFSFCCVITRAWTEQSLRNTWNRHNLHLSFCPSDFSTLASILYLVGNKFEISKNVVFTFDYRARLDDEDDSGDGFERSLFQL